VPSGIIHTIEGSEEIAAVAKENFRQLGLNNIKQYTGTFENKIDLILNEIQHPFIVYLDGNHSYEPTIRYFKIFAENANKESIIILDDIHWSEEMTKAWNEICDFPGTTVKLDLYQMGLVFFNPVLPRLVYNILF
jgi:predicted O-methyltransferase YrrM